MSTDQEERGKRDFRAIVQGLAPAVSVHFGDPVEGKYQVRFKGQHGTTDIRMNETEFADLANDGSGGVGVKGGITLRIRDALKKIGELD